MLARIYRAYRTEDGPGSETAYHAPTTNTRKQSSPVASELHTEQFPSTNIKNYYMREDGEPL